MPDETTQNAAYFSDRCSAMIDTRGLTAGGPDLTPCGLKKGHEGPHEPVKLGKQATPPAVSDLRFALVPLGRERGEEILGVLKDARENLMRLGERDRNHDGFQDEPVDEADCRLCQSIKALETLIWG